MSVLHIPLLNIFAFDPRDPSWQFWFGLISTILAILGFGFGIWSFVKSRQRKQLTYEIVSDTRLVNVNKDLGEDIQIFLEGHEVSDARLLVLKVANTGNAPIEDTDYAPPIRFEFDPDTVIRGGVHKIYPEHFLPNEHFKDIIKLDNDQHQFVELSHLLLNPRSWISLKILTRSKLKGVSGQIKGGRITEFTAPPFSIKRRTALLVGIGLFILGLLLPGIFNLFSAFAQGNCAIGSFQISGSSAFYNTAQAMVTNYRSGCPVAFINVGESTSLSGLQDLENGVIQVANSEIPVNSQGYHDLVEHPVAVIVFAVVINRSVTGVSSLTGAQLLDIYNGHYQNWQQLGGPDLPILVVSRPSTSGTHDTFVRQVLGGNDPQLPPNAKTLDRTDQVLHEVESNSGAIGYVDLGSATRAVPTGNITIVQINGDAPTIGLVESNTYKFWAIEHMDTRQSPGPLVLSFINYVTRNVTTNDTYIRIQDMPTDVINARETSG